MLDSRARLAPVTMPCGAGARNRPPVFLARTRGPLQRGAHSNAGAVDAHHKPSRRARTPLPAHGAGRRRAGTADGGLARPARHGAPAAAQAQAEAEEAEARVHPARHLAARARLDRFRDVDGGVERPARAREPRRVPRGAQLPALLRRPRLPQAGQGRLPDRHAGRQPEPHPARGRRDLGQHQERGHRHRGPALLRARGRGLRGHRASARTGRPQAPRGPGRLDDHAAVRQERAGGPGQSLGVPEIARVGAGVSPRAQVAQGEDPHAVPQHRVLRERRLRDRGRGPHLLRRRRRARGAGRRGDLGGAVPDADAARRGGRPERPARRGGEPRAGGDARGADRLAEPVRPAREPSQRAGPPQPRPPAHVRAGDDHAHGVRGRDATVDPRRGRGRPARLGVGAALLHELDDPAARRPLRRRSRVRRRHEDQDDDRSRAPGGCRAGGGRPSRRRRPGRVARRDREQDRRGQGDGGRLELRRQALQPRHQRPPPARLVLQAVHPPARARGRHRPQQHVGLGAQAAALPRREGPRALQGLELRGLVSGRGLAVVGDGRLGQLGLRRARHAGQAEARGAAREADGHPHRALDEPRHAARRARGGRHAARDGLRLLDDRERGRPRVGHARAELDRAGRLRGGRLGTARRRGGQRGGAQARLPRLGRRNRQGDAAPAS